MRVGHLVGKTAVRISDGRRFTVSGQFGFRNEMGLYLLPDPKVSMHDDPLSVSFDAFVGKERTFRFVT